MKEMTRTGKGKGRRSQRHDTTGCSEGRTKVSCQSTTTRSWIILLSQREQSQIQIRTMKKNLNQMKISSR